MYDYGLITPENLQTWVSEQKFSGTFLLTPSTIQGVPKPRYWFGEFIIISKDIFNDFAIYLFTDAEFYCCVTSGGQWSNSWLQIHPNKYYTNPNLLDNWYFSDPVNQRNGYIIPKDTVIYSDSSLSESSKIGPAAYACTVVESASTYVKVQDAKASSSYYYAAVNAAIPGYCGDRYTVDRWHLTSDGVLTVADEGIRLTSGALFEPFEYELSSLLKGKTVTYSFFFADNTLVTKSAVIPSTWGNWDGLIEIGDIQLIGLESGKRIWARYSSTTTAIAAKLELGSTQTLAHKEGDKWVLNEIPDFGEQLRRCQRYYYQSFKGSSLKTNKGACAFIAGTASSAPMALAFPVEMRTTPAVKIYSPQTGNEGKAAEWITDEDITAACHTDFTNNKVLGINTYGNATIGKTYAFHYTASADL